MIDCENKFTYFLLKPCSNPNYYPFKILFCCTWGGAVSLYKSKTWSRIPHASVSLPPSLHVGNGTQ